MSGLVVGWTAAQTLAMLTAAVVLLAAFVVVEAKAEAPLLPLRLFRLRTLAGSNSVGFLLGASFYGYIFIGTLYMQRAHLAGPFFLTGAVTWVFIPVSIGALVGVTEGAAGITAGLIDSSRQRGGAIGIAVASTVAATRSRILLGQGHAIMDALTGGFHWAFWVCGLVALTAVAVAFLLVRRTETAHADATRPMTHGTTNPARCGSL